MEVGLDSMVEYLLKRVAQLKRVNDQLAGQLEACNRQIENLTLAQEPVQQINDVGCTSDRIVRTAAFVAKALLKERGSAPCFDSSELGKKIVRAIKKGEVDQIHRLAEQKPELLQYRSLLKVDTFGMSLLHIAALSGKSESIQALLSLKMDPLDTDLIGRTPLHVVAASNDSIDLKEVIRALIEATPQAQPGENAPRDASGVTPAGYTSHIKLRNRKHDALKLLHKDGDPSISPVRSLRKSVSKRANTGVRFSGPTTCDYGWCSLPGLRVNNEDTVVSGSNLYGINRDISLYAVFDGHGGDGASKYCEEQIGPLFAELSRSIEDFSPDVLGSVLSELITKLEDGIRSNDDFKLFSFDSTDGDGRMIKKFNAKDSSGTTAIIAVTTKTLIGFANVGDSRGILVTGNELTFATMDHKEPLEGNSGFWEAECNRISQSGGSTRNKRVYLNKDESSKHLAMSRALGDLEYKQNSVNPVVSSEPDVTIFSRDSDQEQFMVLACDGIWDVVSSEQLKIKLLAMIPHKKDLDDVSRSIALECMFESEDNVSLVVVKLKPMVQKNLLNDLNDAFIDLDLI